MIKVLVTAHLGRHFRIFGHYDYKVLLQLGYEVHIAANFRDGIDHFFAPPAVTMHQIDFDRNPLSWKNFKALKQLIGLLSKHRFDLIHTQSPVGGVITRIAAIKARRTGTKVVYTAHGFHFFYGSSLSNWLFYYTIEKFLSLFTDRILTINNEDLEIAQRKFSPAITSYIPGVGVDLSRFSPAGELEKANLRTQMGFSLDSFLLICVGEFNPGKQQDVLISAMRYLIPSIPECHLILVGTGVLLEKLESLAQKMGVAGQVHFLGYRNDIDLLLKASDVALSASVREGLPLSLMEAMATGLPLVVTNCRGNRDLVFDGQNGFVVNLGDAMAFAQAIEKLFCDRELVKSFKKKTLELVKKFSIETVEEEMKKIYGEILQSEGDC